MPEKPIFYIRSDINRSHRIQNQGKCSQHRTRRQVQTFFSALWLSRETCSLFPHKNYLLLLFSHTIGDNFNLLIFCCSEKQFTYRKISLFVLRQLSIRKALYAHELTLHSSTAQYSPSQKKKQRDIPNKSQGTGFCQFCSIFHKTMCKMPKKFDTDIDRI